jgi:hypothetical protein
MLRMLLIVAILLVTVTPTYAQPCNAAALSGELATANNLDQMVVVQDQLSRAIAECRGWYFEGNTGDEPAKASFSMGPFDLEAGVYVVKYEVKMMRYGELDMNFTNLNATEYTDMVYEFRSDVDTFSGMKAVEVEGGRYTVVIEASNILEMTVYIVEP